MSDEGETTKPVAVSPRPARGIKPAAVDIIRKKNLSELAGDGGTLRLRMAALKIRHERLASDVSSLEAELDAVRIVIPVSKSM